MQYFVIPKALHCKIPGDPLKPVRLDPRRTIKGALKYYMDNHKVDSLQFMLNLDQYDLFEIKRLEDTKHHPRYTIMSITSLDKVAID